MPGLLVAFPSEGLLEGLPEGRLEGIIEGLLEGLPEGLLGGIIEGLPGEGLEVGGMGGPGMDGGLEDGGAGIDVGGLVMVGVEQACSNTSMARGATPMANALNARLNNLGKA